MAETNMKFEDAMRELNTLAEKLESGDLPLDQALAAFEKGTELVQHCQGVLKDAELRVEKILAENGQVTTAPFAVEETDA